MQLYSAVAVYKNDAPAFLQQTRNVGIFSDFTDTFSGVKLLPLCNINGNDSVFLLVERVIRL